MDCKRAGSYSHLHIVTREDIFSAKVSLSTAKAEVFMTLDMSAINKTEVIENLITSFIHRGVYGRRIDCLSFILARHVGGLLMYPSRFSNGQSISPDGRLTRLL